MTSIRVRGYAELFTLAERLKNAPKEQQKLYRKAILKSARPGQKAVKTSVPQYMPSGYAPVLKKNLRMRTKIGKRGGVSVRIVAKAKGQQKLRHVGPHNEGVLRHPVFGRRRQPWVAQRVRRGFFSEPLLKTRPAIQVALLKAMSEVADNIAKG